MKLIKLLGTLAMPRQGCDFMIKTLCVINFLLGVDCILNQTCTEQALSRATCSTPKNDSISRDPHLQMNYFPQLYIPINYKLVVLREL